MRKFIFTMHLLNPWVWMTGSTFSWMTTMILILRDFKPILDLNLNSEHMPEERITGSKIDLDLSARSTYMQVYMVYYVYVYYRFDISLYLISYIWFGLENHDVEICRAVIQPSSTLTTVQCSNHCTVLYTLCHPRHTHTHIYIYIYIYMYQSDCSETDYGVPYGCQFWDNTISVMNDVVNVI